MFLQPMLIAHSLDALENFGCNAAGQTASLPNQTYAKADHATNDCKSKRAASAPSFGDTL
jgi:hypothetical protein